MNESAAVLLPFFGKIWPTPIAEAQVISGEFDSPETVYYSLPLKKETVYKAILDFTNPKGGKEILQGDLALLDEAWAPHQIIGLNVFDVTYRAEGLFSVQNDSTVIIRLNNNVAYVKYSMKILPASQ